jgi:S-adenosylmethionine/arginine decarboxylase-like enzyme
MLCPEIYRQRCVVELISKTDLNNFEVTYEMLENFLYDLSGSMGMHIFIGPIIKNTETGPSAIMAWEESGVQVHVWPKYRFIMVEVSSCVPYLVSTVLDSIDQWFDPEKLEVL